MSSTRKKCSMSVNCDHSYNISRNKKTKGNPPPKKSHHVVAFSLPCAEHSQLLKFVRAVGEQTRCVPSREVYTSGGGGHAFQEGFP